MNVKGKCMMAMAQVPDPALDLGFERLVDLPAEKIWAAWTTPALLTQWFTPAPWRTIAAEVDLRPGGLFKTVMQSPEGDTFPNEGVFLEVDAPRRMVSTNALRPEYRPAALPQGGWFFTGILTFTAQGNATLYRATVLHADADARQKHAAMGFEDGWGKALDQLVVLMRG